MCFLVTFCTMQKVTTRSLCREHRGFPNLDSARRNGGFARTQLNPFAALRRLLFPTFCKAQKVGQKIFETFLSEILPCRDGTLRVLFRRLCLLETWSPCSRPFAILPVSAVSDAQKLATGNFLCVRAALSLLLSQQFLPLRGFKFRVIIQNAPKNMTAL